MRNTTLWLSSLWSTSAPQAAAADDGKPVACGVYVREAAVGERTDAAVAHDARGRHVDQHAEAPGTGRAGGPSLLGAGELQGRGQPRIAEQRLGV